MIWNQPKGRSVTPSDRDAERISNVHPCWLWNSMGCPLFVCLQIVASRKLSRLHVRLAFEEIGSEILNSELDTTPPAFNRTRVVAARGAIDAENKAWVSKPGPTAFHRPTRQRTVMNCSELLGSSGAAGNSYSVRRARMTNCQVHPCLQVPKFLRLQGDDEQGSPHLGPFL